MLTRIEINLIYGQFAFGAIIFDDGTSEPIQIPISAYQALCDRNFFVFPEDLPPEDVHKNETEGDENENTPEQVVNYTEVWYSPTAISTNILEASSGQRVF